MASTILATILVACAGFCAVAAGAHSKQGFLDAGGAGSAGAGRQEVATQDIEVELSRHLEAAHRGRASDQRLAAIEGKLARSYQALPKNAWGRLAPRAVRHAVHSYFAREHGWLISGLEPHGHQAEVTELHEVGILRDRAPALVEAMLEARQRGRGLSLEDLTAMTATLERLILDESTDLLEAAYYLNERSVAEPLNETSLEEVLSSYLLLFEIGEPRNLSDIQTHQLIKAKLKESRAPFFSDLLEFQRDVLLNRAFAHRGETNPFTARSYGFDVASGIVDELAHSYGRWQNAECRRMKEHLMDLSPDGSGAVPLNVFYSEEGSTEYRFSESVDYLRAVGAIDEATNTVRIANYLIGPSNCVATSSYYSVCCLNECDGLVAELEEQVQAPVAAPEQLVRLVSNLSSASVDAPRQLPHALVGRLKGIAEVHAGDVPLHGRLFAQWMHLAFPSECPFPHIVEEASALTAARWSGGQAAASEEEVQLRSREEEARQGEIAPEWSTTEVLPLAEPARPSRTPLGSVVFAAVQLALFGVVLSTGLAGWHAAASAARGVVWETDAAGKPKAKSWSATGPIVLQV